MNHNEIQSNCILNFIVALGLSPNWSYYQFFLRVFLLVWTPASLEWRSKATDIVGVVITSISVLNWIINRASSFLFFKSFDRAFFDMFALYDTVIILLALVADAYVFGNGQYVLVFQSLALVRLVRATKGSWRFITIAMFSSMQVLIRFLLLSHFLFGPRLFSSLHLWVNKTRYRFLWKWHRRLLNISVHSCDRVYLYSRLLLLIGVG